MASVHGAGSGDGSTPRADLRDEAGASLGTLLRRARERRGLTLQQIAKETKLPQRHLEALERDNLGLTPAGFYQRAEIRAYARAVGVDETLALSYLNPSLKPVETRATPVETSANQPSPRWRTYPVIALGLVVVAGAVFGRSVFERAPGLERGADHQGVATPVANPPLPVPDDSIQPATLQRDPPQPAAAPPAVSSGSVIGSAEAAKAVPPSDPGVQAAQDTSSPLPPVSGTELVVTTQPEGARVTVDGFSWGVTPVTIHHLPPGDKRIRLTKEGYATEERVLRLTSGRRQALDIPLTGAQ